MIWKTPGGDARSSWSDTGTTSRTTSVDRGELRLWAATKTALRVLTAVNAKRLPDTADIAELLRLSPQLAGLPAADLACGAIRQVLRESV